MPAATYSNTLVTTLASLAQYYVDLAQYDILEIFRQFHTLLRNSLVTSNFFQ